MDKTRLERLKKLYEITDEGLTREEFMSAFKMVLETASKVELKALEKVNNAIDELKGLNSTSLQATQADLRRFQTKVGQSITSALKEQKNALNFLRDKVRSLRNGQDGKSIKGDPGEPGKDADEEKIIKEVLKRIELPDLLEEIDKLRVDLFEEVRQNKRLGGGGFSKIAMESKFIDDETPSGTVNGVNDAFTLANTPNPPASVKVYVNGSRMRITEDYTLSGRTITFVTAPPTNSIILCDYRQ